ncbi:hypothetical protein LJR225_002140 [Phenylobacterium sp. LjRoot225]|uniref:hypothetical protein n=1 Tax=Phenylobacterium sp. LjRoot225 TaxID=3342285 RepID=UPI003ECF01B4
MSLARYRQVVIFCPTGVTGGPEAIHQLSHALNAIGVRCSLVHIGPTNTVRVAGGKLIAMEPPHPGVLQAYAEYAPQVPAEIPVDANTLLIFPEGLAWLQHRFVGCGVAVWWLSIDNFFRALGADDDEDADVVLRRVLGRADLIHLHQSVYARDWLRERGVEQLYDLADYTSTAFTAAPARSPSPSPAISYNGAKGSDLAADFFAANPQFDALPLRGYSRGELRAIFRARRIYVDFGHFPGKDRLPREAAVSGSVVFIHRHASGDCYDDFPLPDLFKFTREDALSGALASRLAAAQADPARHWAAQETFRDRVLWEKTQFYDQARRHWGVAPPTSPSNPAR